MTDSSNDRPNIIRITSVDVTLSVPARTGKGQHLAPNRWTVYGVDASGVEHIYAEHTSEEEHQAWLASDPLWPAAQSALVEHLLDDPIKRNVVRRSTDETESTPPDNER